MVKTGHIFGFIPCTICIVINPVPVVCTTTVVFQSVQNSCSRLWGLPNVRTTAIVLSKPSDNIVRSTAVLVSDVVVFMVFIVISDLLELFLLRQLLISYQHKNYISHSPFTNVNENRRKNICFLRLNDRNEFEIVLKCTNVQPGLWATISKRSGTADLQD